VREREKKGRECSFKNFYAELARLELICGSRRGGVDRGVRKNKSEALRSD